MKIFFTLVATITLFSSLSNAQSLETLEKFSADMEKSKVQSCQIWIEYMLEKEGDPKKKAGHITWVINKLLERVNPKRYEDIMIVQGDLKKMDRIIKAFATMCEAYPTSKTAWTVAEEA